MADQKQGQPAPASTEPTPSPEPAPSAPSGGGSQPQPQPSAEKPWLGTFKDESAMWDGYRNAVSHMQRTQQGMAALERKLQEREDAFSKLQEEMAPFRELSERLSGRSQSQMDDKAKAELVDMLLSDPDAAFQRLMEKHEPAWRQKHLDPLLKEREAERQAALARQTDAQIKGWYDEYGAEFCDAVAEQVRSEAQQGRGDEWLQLHRNPAVMDYRLTIEYLKEFTLQMIDAVEKNDRNKLATLLAKENAGSPSGAPAYPVSPQSPAREAEAEMDAEWAAMRGR